MRWALLSVHNKEGIVEFGRGLQELGFGLLASGGTAKTLRDAGLPVTEVAERTGESEFLGGRVKTLHPSVHGGILARRGTADDVALRHRGIEPIDIVCVNLYPFSLTIARLGCTLEQAIEEIDIGGVALIRAAAKNAAHVYCVTSPEQYKSVLDRLRADEGTISPTFGAGLRLEAFTTTALYEMAISTYFAQLSGGWPPWLLKAYQRWKGLRYGENPHQRGALYLDPDAGGPLDGALLQEGKGLSYTNLLDLDVVYRAACAYDPPTVAIVKHASLCGIAQGDTLEAAYEAAHACDPISAFGGVIGCNLTVDESLARAFSGPSGVKRFMEAVIAPNFTNEAREILARKPDCRVLQVREPRPGLQVRSVLGGLLVQELDQGDPPNASWTVVSKRQPTAEENEGLRFAWKALPYVRSNTILLAKGGQAVGIGGGQPSRVDAAKIAIAKAGLRAKDAVAASDAFFPFPDAVEELHRAGITAVIQTGGSKRDAEVLAFADRIGMAMVVTGVRHFTH